MAEQNQNQKILATQAEKPNHYTWVRQRRTRRPVTVTKACPFFVLVDIWRSLGSNSVPLFCNTNAINIGRSSVSIGTSWISGDAGPFARETAPSTTVRITTARNTMRLRAFAPTEMSKFSSSIITYAHLRKYLIEEWVISMFCSWKKIRQPKRQFVQWKSVVAGRLNRLQRRSRANWLWQVQKVAMFLC